MKSSATVLIVGLTLALTSPAFAGRDQSQILQQERAIKALHAERLIQAKQVLASVSAVEPFSASARAGRRDPTAHP